MSRTFHRILITIFALTVIANFAEAAWHHAFRNSDRVGIIILPISRQRHLPQVI